MIYTILMGGAAGYIAGQIMKGKGFGFLMNIIIGIAGSLLGSFLLKILGFDIGLWIIGDLITATIGAVLLVVIVSFIKGDRDV